MSGRIFDDGPSTPWTVHRQKSVHSSPQNDNLGRASELVHETDGLSPNFGPLSTWTGGRSADGRPRPWRSCPHLVKWPSTFTHERTKIWLKNCSLTVYFHNTVHFGPDDPPLFATLFIWRITKMTVINHQIDVIWKHHQNGRFLLISWINDHFGFEMTVIKNQNNRSFCLEMIKITVI